MASEGLYALAGVLVGAIASGTVNYGFWKLQHKETLRTSEERERHKQQVQMTDRLQEVADQLIELGGASLSGPHIDQTQLSTATYMELVRLRREFLVVSNLARNAFENEDLTERLRVFQEMVSEAILPGRGQTEAEKKNLRSYLDDLCTRLRRKMV